MSSRLVYQHKVTGDKISVYKVGRSTYRLHEIGTTIEINDLRKEWNYLRVESYVERKKEQVSRDLFEGFKVKKLRVNQFYYQWQVFWNEELVETFDYKSDAIAFMREKALD